MERAALRATSLSEVMSVVMGVAAQKKMRFRHTSMHLQVQTQNIISDNAILGSLKVQLDIFAKIPKGVIRPPRLLKSAF